MARIKLLPLAVAVMAAALAASACGDNPAGPSGAVVLRGTVLGDSASSAASGAAAAAAARVTITVEENPSLTTTVSGNGTFELEGLPEGGFTLVFSSNGVTLGTITINDVSAGETITITVKVTANSVTLVLEEREDDEEGEDDGEAKTCLINGGKVGQRIELEGHVDGAGTSASFVLKVNGNRARGPVDVDGSGATYKCNGAKLSDTLCKASLKSGSKVHVRGDLQSCDLAAASVRATQVTVQKP
jgi:hypothetical protein